MSNAAFLDRVFRSKSMWKFIDGFSRPLYHNWAGLCYGHRFDKRKYGGMIRHTEAAMLYLWARELPRDATIVEIGCYGGLSTSYLALGCRGNGGRIFSIDPFDSCLDRQEELCDSAVKLEAKPSRQTVMKRLEAHGLHTRVELIEGFSQDVAKTWNRPVHFLWIDGNHDQAYQDYVDWSPFLVPGARVALHDAHPRYGLERVAQDAYRIFNSDAWTRLEHVKGIVTGVRSDAR